MANEKNLIPFDHRSENEAREMGRKGGKASGVSRRRKKSLREAADYYLSLPVSEIQSWNQMALDGIDPEDIDRQMEMVRGLQQAASSGDARAAKVLVDVIGNELSEDDATSADVLDYLKVLSTIAPAFLPTLQRIILEDDKWEKITELVEKGGRGSTKSTFASALVLLLLKQHPDCHAVCLRKVGNTLRNSVYAQIKWTIDALGLTDLYEYTVSPMAITNIQTGQQILFFGLDDPNKIKSIKLSFGYIGVLWLEELDQFEGDKEVRNVEQSCLRGGDFSFTIKTFNPPAMARNWVNQYVLDQKPNQIIQHSDYKSVPAHWLGPRFLSDAEHLRETNETAYRHEYLGEVVGSGTAVFENLRLEPISDDQIQHFDRILHGVDWGYYPDPWAYNGCYYDATHKTLYIFDEMTRRRASNQETGELLLNRGIIDTITCDSSEPKSVADYRSYGLRAREAIKGPGSVNYSHKWLQSLAAIMIDPQRCPDTAKEFAEYEYERDKQGEILEGYPDVDNHHIDAVRYATEQIWRRKGQ